MKGYRNMKSLGNDVPVGKQDVADSRLDLADLGHDF